MRLDELDGDGDLLARVADSAGQTGWTARRAGRWYPLDEGLSTLCGEGIILARDRIERAAAGTALDAEAYTVLAPVDPTQEVWAAGVTYERSRTARIEESEAPDLYAAVYANPRPELFFKAIGRRVVGPGEAIGVRADARWSVPEPELAVIFDAAGRTLGFTIGDDVSSRDIEGANALYLPQAKVYDRSCALGPAIVLAWTLGDSPAFKIELLITRGTELVFSGVTSTAELHRHWEELGRWLWAGLTFEAGTILLTGTGIVPEDDVSLADGDAVTVRISTLGALENSVRTVGAAVATA